uniref:Alfin N-terminal domain-containing protein n=1 Tax=Zea mays TaxID=4577 RepID=A0A804UFD1_MAIZE
MLRRDWLTLVAVHSDSWLISVVFFCDSWVIFMHVVLANAAALRFEMHKLTEVVKANEKMLIAAGNFVIPFYKHNTFHESQTNMKNQLINSEVYLAEKMDRYLGDNWKSFTSVLLESSKLCWNQDEVCCRLPACYPH